MKFLTTCESEAPATTTVGAQLQRCRYVFIMRRLKNGNHTPSQLVPGGVRWPQRSFSPPSFAAPFHGENVSSSFILRSCLRRSFAEGESCVDVTISVSPRRRASTYMSYDSTCLVPCIGAMHTIPTLIRGQHSSRTPFSLFQGMMGHPRGYPSAASRDRPGCATVTPTIGKPTMDLVPTNRKVIP